MTNIKAAPSIFTAEVIIICRKASAPLPVSVILVVTEAIVAEEANRAVETIVEADKDLSLIESGAGFELVDIANVAIGTNSAGIRLRDSAGHGRINIPQPNHMLDLNHENAGEHRELIRQLTLDLKAAAINCWCPQVGCHAVSDLPAGTWSAQLGHAGERI